MFRMGWGVGLLLISIVFNLVSVVVVVGLVSVLVNCVVISDVYCCLEFNFFIVLGNLVILNFVEMFSLIGIDLVIMLCISIVSLVM